ncbi:MAG: hypothetical protein JWL82_285 [Parcubacteria group bacterium]|nr:hypothetical protein [Parcubacteria group bacterium]
MAIKIESGIATIEVSGSSDRYVGCTSDKGTFPPIGMDYRTFTFQPEPGTKGVLIFSNKPDRHSGDIYGGNYFILYQYYWTKGKLVVDYGLTKPIYPFSESMFKGNFGYMVQYRNRIYITNRPDGATFNYFLVDPMVMIRFLAGVATFADLDRNARHVKRHREFEFHYSELKELLAHADSRLGNQGIAMDGLRSELADAIGAAWKSSKAVGALATWANSVKSNGIAQWFLRDHIATLDKLTVEHSLAIGIAAGIADAMKNKE